MSFVRREQELPRAGLGGDVVCGKRARIAPRRACRGCCLREKGKNCPAQSLSGMSFAGKGQELPRAEPVGDVAQSLSGMSFAGKGQELPRAEPVGDVVCGRRARIVPRRVWRGCRLREKDKNCPARRLAGMPFVRREQELPRAGLSGDVVCGRRARIAPRRACRGCRLREKGKNCPARDLAGMPFAGGGQE